PFMMQERRCYLPDDVMAAHGTSTQKLFDFNERGKVPDVVRDIVQALPPAPKTPSKHLRVMNKMIDLYLAQIEREGLDVFNPALSLPPRFLAARVALGGLLERIRCQPRIAISERALGEEFFASAAFFFSLDTLHGVSLVFEWREQSEIDIHRLEGFCL